jgi:hypothetical protein
MIHYKVFESDSTMLFLSIIVYLVFVTFVVTVLPTISSPKTPKKRNVIDARTKLEIIQKAKTMKGVDLAKKYNLSTSTISTIMSSEPTLVKLIAKNIITEKTKRYRAPDYPKLERAVDVWFSEMKSRKNVTISGPDIQEKALFFAGKLGYDNFKASNGWLENFRKRHNIVFKSNCGEAGLVNTKLVDEWIAGQLLDHIQNYKIEDIFNCDETGLFYKALPTRSMQYVNKENNSVKVGVC